MNPDDENKVSDPQCMESIRHEYLRIVQHFSEVTFDANNDDLSESAEQRYATVTIALGLSPECASVLTPRFVCTIAGICAENIWGDELPRFFFEEEARKMLETGVSAVEWSPVFSNFILELSPGMNDDVDDAVSLNAMIEIATQYGYAR